MFSIETGFSVTTDLPDFAAVPLWCSANKKELPHWIQVRGEGRERERSVIYVVAGGVQCTAYSIV
jgi:hypothetical protein